MEIHGLTGIFVAAGALMSGLAGFLSAVVGLLNHSRLREVHLSLDGRLDRLLDATHAAAHAEGVTDEKERALTEATDRARVTP